MASVNGPTSNGFRSLAQTGMRVAGVIENMATFVAPDTGKEYRIFGEDPEHFVLDGRYFQAVDEQGYRVQPEKSISKPNEVRVLTILPQRGPRLDAATCSPIGGRRWTACRSGFEG